MFVKVNWADLRQFWCLLFLGFFSQKRSFLSLSRKMVSFSREEEVCEMHYFICHLKEKNLKKQQPHLVHQLLLVKNSSFFFFSFFLVSFNDMDSIFTELYIWFFTVRGRVTVSQNHFQVESFAKSPRKK